MAFQMNLCFAASSDVFFHLVVHDENDGTSETTEDIREAALEESGNASFVFHDLASAVDRSTVQSSRALARLHHHSTSDSIDRVCDDSSKSLNSETNTEREHNVGFFGIVESHRFYCVIKTEEASSVDDNSDNGDGESLVEASNTVSFVDLSHAVTNTVELSLRSALSDISAESSSRKIKRIDKSHRRGTSGSTSCQHTSEKLPKVGFLVVSDKELLVFFFEGEIERLSWEVSDTISHVSSPEGKQSLLSIDSGEAVHHSSVWLDTSTFHL